MSSRLSGRSASGRQALKLAVAALSFVALAAWWRWVGYVGDATVVGILASVPVAPLIAMLIPPARGNRYLAVMVACGIGFAIVPWVGRNDDNLIVVVVLIVLGICGCVVSWTLLAHTYWIQHHGPIDWLRILSR